MSAAVQTPWVLIMHMNPLTDETMESSKRGPGNSGFKSLFLSWTPDDTWELFVTAWFWHPIRACSRQGFIGLWSQPMMITRALVRLGNLDCLPQRHHTEYSWSGAQTIITVLMELCDLTECQVPQGEEKGTQSFFASDCLLVVQLWSSLLQTNSNIGV